MKKKVQFKTGNKGNKKKKNTKRGKSRDNSDTKNLTDYFLVSGIKRSTVKTNDQSESKMVVPKTRQTNISKTTFKIVKNPSKPRKLVDILNQLDKYGPLANSSILINENNISNIYELLKDNISSIFNSFNTFSYGFNATLLRSIITKFIIQFNTNFIYISSALNQDLDQNIFEQRDQMSQLTKDINLFKGFQDIKLCSMPYLPCNLEEAQLLWPNLSNIISNYLFNFTEEKALFIYDPIDYLSSINKIKTICNLMQFNIIRIDDNETNKVQKLNKISEARKSMQLTFLEEDINNILFILESVVNNYETKLRNLFEDDKENKDDGNQKINLININKRKKKKKSEDDTSVTTSLSNGSNKGQSQFNLNSFISPIKKRTDLEDVISSLGKVIPEENMMAYNLYKTIQTNIYQFYSKKKSLIFISDTFSNNNGKNASNSQKYFSSIVSKITGSKIPIIILSNNLEPLKHISHSNFNKKFIFAHTLDTLNNTQQKDIIGLTKMILYLHSYYGDLKYKELNNFEEITEYIEDNQSSITQSKTKKFIGKVLNLAELVSHKNSFDFNKICSYLHNIFQKINYYKDIKQRENSGDDLFDLSSLELPNPGILESIELNRFGEIGLETKLEIIEDEVTNRKILEENYEEFDFSFNDDKDYDKTPKSYKFNRKKGNSSKIKQLALLKYFKVAEFDSFCDYNNTQIERKGEKNYSEKMKYILNEEREYSVSTNLENNLINSELPFLMPSEKNNSKHSLGNLIYEEEFKEFQNEKRKYLMNKFHKNIPLKEMYFFDELLPYDHKTETQQIYETQRKENMFYEFASEKYVMNHNYTDRIRNINELKKIIKTGIIKK
ncbi:MAG: hypothetical protein MJ252_22770 [archaeon]|nr:hypothetical protein [archaeon]